MENIEIVAQTDPMDYVDVCEDDASIPIISETERRMSMYDTDKNNLNTKPTYEMEEDCVFEEFSFFLHKTKGALMMLIRYEDFDVDFDNEDEQNCSRGALRVYNVLSSNES